MPLLLDLWAASTTVGGTTWSIRPKDGFAALRAEAGEWRVAIAQSDSGEIVGSASVACRVSHLDGHRRPTCYGTRFFVRPDWRGRGIGDELFTTAAEYGVEIGGESVPVLLVVREGNRSMRSRIQGPRGLPRFQPIALLDSYMVYSRHAAAAPLPPDVIVHPATPGDLEAMAALGARVWPDRQFAPAMGAGELARWIATTPGLQLGDFLIARINGQMVGWMGWWNDQQFRDVLIVDRTPLAAGWNALHAARARLTGASLPPRIGDRVGTLLALRSCVPGSHPSVLRALIIDAARRRQGECAWIQIALDHRDPLREGLAGLGSRVTRLGAYVVTPRAPGCGAPVLDRPLHFDIALV